MRDTVSWLQVLLSVAQIDMVYSQYALLHLLAFLNEGYPPPNLDPLLVRTSVTLHEIVRERLVGPKRPHQVQKHQQSQMKVQVSIQPPPSLGFWFSRSVTDTSLLSTIF